MRKATRKAYEITDAKIQFVSLVDKAANLRKFLLTRAADGQAAFTTYGRIIKTDAENHYVTGIVYEPLTEDSHGNYMTEDEIVKACYWYSENGDKVDLQHSFEPLDGCSVVENWVAKADFTVGDEVVKKGTWLMTVKVTNGDIWKGIMNGEITGLSMGGVGNYSEEDVELDNVSKQATTQETSKKKGLLQQLAKALGVNVVEKGAMTEIYEERSKGTLFWDAMNTLEEVLYRYDNITGRWLYEADESRVRECLEEFSQIITNILTGSESITKAIQTARPVEKAGKKMSTKNRETLQGIYDRLGSFLKEFDDPEPDEEPDKKKDGDNPSSEEPEDSKTNPKTKTDKEENQVTKQEVEQIVSASIAKAMGDNDQQAASQAAQNGAEAVGKARGEENTARNELTSKTIEKMVEEAIRKQMKPQQETVTAEQVQNMISEAVSRAVDPLLKSKGLPSNLNSTVIKDAGNSEQHYLHGIL